MQAVKAASLALVLSYAQAGRSNTRVIQLEREGVSDRRGGGERRRQNDSSRTEEIIYEGEITCECLWF